MVRRADGYYAQFCLDVERKEQGQYTGNVIGIDLGLKAFYTDQNGHTVECPKYLRKAEKRLKRHQKRLSRKFRKGAKPQSKNYHKQRKRLGKAHLQVQRQRKDWAIKQARCVVMSNDIVAYEDLKHSEKGAKYLGDRMAKGNCPARRNDWGDKHLCYGRET